VSELYAAVAYTRFNSHLKVTLMLNKYICCCRVVGLRPDIGFQIQETPNIDSSMRHISLSTQPNGCSLTWVDDCHQKVTVFM